MLSRYNQCIYVILILWLIGVITTAKSAELIVGGIIHHLQPIDGIKTTQLQQNIIIKSNDINVLIGNNSVSKPIIGIGYDVPLGKSDHNFKVGAYIQDSKEFEKVGVYAPTLMPVIGLELNFYASEDDMVGISQFISPIITFTGVSIRF